MISILCSHVVRSTTIRSIPTLIRQAAVSLVPASLVLMLVTLVLVSVVLVLVLVLDSSVLVLVPPSLVHVSPAPLVPQGKVVLLLEDVPLYTMTEIGSSSHPILLTRTQ